MAAHDPVNNKFFLFRLTCSWLQEVITCVCISSSEFQAASAVAQLLSLSTDTHQVSNYVDHDCSKKVTTFYVCLSLFL